MHNDFAFLLSKQKRYAAAERHYRKAIAISRSVYDLVHPRTMMYRGNLVGTLMRHEKYAEAEAIMRQKLKALREHTPSDSTRLVEARVELGTLHAEQGRFAKAVAPMRLQYRSYQKRFGEKHLWTVRQAGELGAVLKALGQDREADVLLRQNYAHLQAKRDTILQHRDSYTRLDTEYSLRFMVRIFEQASLPDLVRRYRALREQYTITPNA